MSKGGPRFGDGHRPWEPVVIGLIVTNSGVLWWHTLHPDQDLWGHVHHAFLVVFTVEWAYRLGLAGWQPRVFARSFWNCFDTLVLAAALLPILPVSVTALRLLRLGRAAHVLSHVSHLWLIRAWWTMAVPR